MAVTFELDQKTIADIRKRLGDAKDKAPKVIAYALNDTAKQARRLLAKQAKAEYTIKTTDFVKDMNIDRASAGSLTAVIRSEGATHSLTHFKYSAPKSGAKAQVLKSGGLKALVRDGNKAFYGSGKLNGHIFQRLTKKQLPIKKLHSNSIPKMIESEKHVYGLKKAEIGQLLEKNVNRQIARILGGH